MFALQLVTVALAAVAVQQTAGHGMMLEPPNRSSLWRYDGFPNAIPNYSDNENFCGGREVQHHQNGGKCGECGDNWALPRPRNNENGGKYGKGFIAKTYKSGETIHTETMLTANHMGWFEYRLCVLDSPDDLETEECFNKHLLTLEGGVTSTRYEVLTSLTGIFPVTLHLPQGVTCKRCVLQWHYNTANSWGVCENGTMTVGCGPQENFRSCTDISIE